MYSIFQYWYSAVTIIFSLLEAQNSANGSHDNANGSNQCRQFGFCTLVLLNLPQHNGGIHKDQGCTEGSSSYPRDESQIGQLGRHSGNESNHSNRHFILQFIVAFALLNFEQIQQSIPGSNETQRVAAFLFWEWAQK